MSTLERKEYQETQVLRTVSPVRNFRSTSNQNLSQFDNKLDYLLEDLQNSVSRPGSSLSTYRDTSSRSHTLDSGRGNSLTRVANVKSSNPLTEYSSDDAYSYASPDGRKQVTGYKKESYSYKTSGGLDVAPPEKVRMQNSINQLDSLLDDLQQVKKTSFTEKESYNSTGLDPTFQNTSNKRSVNRELHYGDSPVTTSRSRTLERSERESSVTRDMQYSNEGTYGDLRPLRPTSPSSRTSTLSKQTKVSNVKNFPLEVVETTVPDIDADVLAHLDPNLRPPGNTKVTTTIKTYTYEIPGSGGYPTNLDANTTVNEKYVYSPNESQTTPSKSFVYNKIENNSSENRVYSQDPGWKSKLYNKETVTDNVVNYNYPPYQKPTPPGGSTVVKETVTTRNYQPGYSPELSPPTQQTYVYNESTTTKNINGYQPPPPPPPTKNTYIIKETTNTSVNNKTVPYSERDYPVYNPPRQDTYIYKETTHNTKNRTVGHPPYSNGYPPNDKTVIYKHESNTTNNYGNRPADVDTFDPKHPPYNQRNPNEPLNIHYKYTSSSSTTNNFKGGYPPGDDSQTLLPSRFPTDSEIVDAGPPKKLDELMATIGHEPPNSPLNAGYTAHEQELAQQKKIDTLKQQHAELDDSQNKGPVQRTKNVSGPPVYYPPGHELFASKEEGGGAWKQEGGYAKASGKYEYEASSKSKSKSSSGATVVPVCLPLCCGLPCTIL